MENIDIHKQLNEETKLMKKSKILLISFFFITLIDLFLFIIFQDHPLFIFKLSRSADHISAYGSYQLISIILFATVILYLIAYILLLITYLSQRKNEESNYQLLKKRYGFFDFFTVIPVFFLLMMIVNGIFFSLAVVDGESMAPTYCSNDVVLINYLSKLEHEDVIVFSNDDTLFIKRLVGLPGDLLIVDDNGVSVNGVLIEDYSGDFYYNGLIQDDYYFVLGDNRFNSLDSRDNRVGLVKADDLIGVVIFDLTNKECQAD